MPMMILFFLIVIVLELLCLVGIVYAYIWLTKGELVLQGLRVGMVALRSDFFHQLLFGKQVGDQVQQVARLLGNRLPLWVRGMFTGLRWMGKIKQ